MLRTVWTLLTVCSSCKSLHHRMENVINISCAWSASPLKSLHQCVENFGLWPNKNRVSKLVVHYHVFWEKMSNFGLSKKIRFVFPLSIWQWCFRQACTKNAQIYNNVCNLFTHNLCMHFKLACKVHICVLENHILCNARMHHQQPWVSSLFLSPINYKINFHLISHIHRTGRGGESSAVCADVPMVFNSQKSASVTRRIFVTYKSIQNLRVKGGVHPTHVTKCFICCTSRVPTSAQTLKEMSGYMRTWSCSPP